MMNRADVKYRDAVYQRECALADLTIEAKLYYNVNPIPETRLARAAVIFGRADAIMRQCALDVNYRGDYDDC
jgi:hypothetical protein